MILFTRSNGGKCWQILWDVRYILCVMKIKLSNPVVVSPSRGITLPVSGSSICHVMCKKSLVSAINKVIGNCLVEQPTNFGRYFQGVSDLTITALLHEGGTKSVDVTVNLELHASTLCNQVKCLIFVGDICYGNVGFRAKVDF